VNVFRENVTKKPTTSKPPSCYIFNEINFTVVHLSIVIQAFLVIMIL